MLTVDRTDFSIYRRKRSAGDRFRGSSEIVERLSQAPRRSTTGMDAKVSSNIRSTRSASPSRTEEPDQDAVGNGFSSVEELRERLLEGRGATKANVEEVIARLREYGYLDDAKFAHSYAALRLRERPIGRRRLQRDLWLKKVDKQTAETALDEIFEATPETDLIDRAIAKRIRLRGKPQTRAEAKKLFDHLLRQGFGFDLVSEKVRALAQTKIDNSPD